MTPRMPKERLEEIRELLEDHWFSDNPNTNDVEQPIRDLLAELREVTRERDEARATAKRLQEAYLPGRWEKLREIEQERHKLKQELADLNYKAGNEYAIVMHYKGEMDALRAENAKLKAALDGRDEKGKGVP